MKKIYLLPAFAIALAILPSLWEGTGVGLAQNFSFNTTGAVNSSISMVEILQLSTAASSRGLYVLHSGTIAGTGYGIWAEKTGGAGTTNIAGYFTASGAGTNYGLWVNAGSVNIQGLTASNFVKTNASKDLISQAQVSLTTEVTGVLPIANGGTNRSTIGAAGTVPYSDGTNYQFMAAGTAGQVLTSQGAGAPTWTTPVSKISFPIGQCGVAAAINTWYSANNNGTGINSVANPASILYSYVSNGPSFGYIASSASTFSKQIGVVSSSVAGRIITIYVYKYVIVNNSSANLVGTLINSVAITCTVANDNYTYTVPASGTPADNVINQAAFIIVWYRINGAASMYNQGTLELTTP